MFDFMWENVREKFVGIEGVAVREARALGLVWVEIHDIAVVRLKKFDDRNMPSSSPSQLCLDYMAQMELPLVPLPSGAVHLFCGYKLNIFQTEIREVTFTCPNGDHNEWFFVVGDEEENVILAERPAETSQDDLPIRPIVPPTPEDEIGSALNG